MSNKQQTSKQHRQEYLQSAIFGFNDALVSTTGVIVGVSTGTSDKQVVVLAGIVTILVEALSMGAGQYLSLKSAIQYGKSHDTWAPINSGIIMFVAYFLAGLVPLLSIVFFPIEYSRNVAIAAALVGLIALGIAKAVIVGESKLRSATEMFVVGGLATAIGIIAGNMFGV